MRVTSAAPARRTTVRGRLAFAAAVVVLGGLRVSRFDGVAADVAGGLLYAVLVVLLLAFVRPSARPSRVAAVGLGICVLVELAQLTGVPAALVAVVPPLRFVLGTTFWAWDLVAYAAGAALAALVLSALRQGLRPGGADAARDHG